MTWRAYTVMAVAVALTVGFGAGLSSATTNAPARSQAFSATSPSLSGFRQGMVPVSGGRVHYVIGGSGPALVLLHGWPQTWWQWHYVMPALARDHTVIAFDMPGLGDSTIPSSGGYGGVITGRRLHEAVNALGLHHVAVFAFGLSVAGAYDWARDYPSEVTRLGVMEAPLNGFGLEDDYASSFHLLFNQEPAPIPENMVNNRLAEITYLNYIFSMAHQPAGLDRDRDVYYAAYANPANRSAGYGYYRAFPQNKTDDLANASHKLTIPVLAMGGQYSSGMQTAQSFEKVATDVRPVVAPGSGHFITEEIPGWLSGCAGLFFSSSPHPKPPSPEYQACVP